MADARVGLRWTGAGMVFEGGAVGGSSLVIDGDGRRGASPMQALLLSLCGCMGADLVDIAGRMRVGFDSLVLRIDADRAPTPPRYYTRIRLVVEVAGAADADAPKLQRALDLSRETYCSVLHTLRPDTEITTELVLTAAAT
jgi:putative redox protein